jgi:hypothetical protein
LRRPKYPARSPLELDVLWLNGRRISRFVYAGNFARRLDLDA